MALPDGNRWLRANPPDTSMMSPRFPTPSTSLRNRTLTLAISGLAFRADRLGFGLGGHGSAIAGDGVVIDARFDHHIIDRGPEGDLVGDASHGRQGPLGVVGIGAGPTPALSAPVAAASVAIPAPAAAPTRALGGGPLGVGQQYQLTGGFDGEGDVALVLGAVTRHPASPDLSAVAHVLAEHVDVLVVNPLDAVLADGARLLLDATPGVLGGPAG